MIVAEKGQVWQNYFTGYMGTVVAVEPDAIRLKDEAGGESSIPATGSMAITCCASWRRVER